MLPDLRSRTARVQTGPICFDNDWCGIYLRGDDAVAVAAMLSWAAKNMKPADKNRPKRYEEMAEMMRSCWNAAEETQRASLKEI